MKEKPAEQGGPRVQDAARIIGPSAAPRNLLARIWGDIPGRYCVVGIAGGTARHHWVADADEAQQRAQELDASGADAYFAPSGFDPDGVARLRATINPNTGRPYSGRDAKIAIAISSFWIDIDCGEGEPYADWREGLAALTDWCRKHEVPLPAIGVLSGYGLHVYWLLDRAYSRDDWLPVAQHLKQALKVGQVHADPARTADAASILRVPGTHNYKGEEPQPVRVLWERDQRVSLQAFERALPSVGPIRGAAERGGADEWDVPDNYPPGDAEAIAGKCAQMREIRDKQGAVSEPFWRAGLSVLWRCKGGEQLIHEWSKGDERYDPRQTQDKAERTLGPSTCQHFDEVNPGVCTGCPHAGRVSSPIQLTGATSDEDEDTGGRRSAATTLVTLARRRYTFGTSTDGEPFAIPRSGPLVVSTLRGNRHSLRSQLAREYFARTGRAATQQALTDALQVLDGLAQEADPRPLYLRTAELDGRLWIDLGDRSGRAICVAAGQWTLHDAPPVLFKRTALNSPMPEPEPGGTLDDLWRFLNVAEADRPLVLAWLVASLCADMAHPVLAFFGEQGTGKTTAQRLLVDLVDPSPVPTRKPPRDAESWVTAAAGSWVVGLDNLSTVPDWLSDSICRAVTGDGDVRRRLYTDGDHAVFAYRRCVILNSIDLGALRGDLAERTLPIQLEPITESARIGDADIWPTWRAIQARTLGALLDLAAGVAGVLPSVRIERRPRMADFARVLAAVDRVLDTAGLEQYLRKQHHLASDALSADPFVVALVNNLHGGFEGTAAELMDRLTPDRPPKTWPASARAATQRLHRHAPALRKSGWYVSDDAGKNHAKVLRWTIQPEKPRDRYPQHPQDPQGPAGCGLEPPATAGAARVTPAADTALTRAIEGLAGLAGVAGNDRGASQADDGHGGES